MASVGTIGAVGSEVGTWVDDALVGGSPVGTTGSVGAEEVLPGIKGVNVGPAGVGITPQPNATSNTMTTNKIRCLDFTLLTSLNYITQDEACKKTGLSATQFSANTLSRRHSRLLAEEGHDQSTRASEGTEPRQL